MAERTHFGLARIARETVPAFELYDLRIEVIGPPDRAIYCGDRLGDYFELQGEMLTLPPRQGFSIYSLAALQSVQARVPRQW